MQHEPLRLHRSWGTAAMVFAMWDGALLWGVWWACSHFGGVALQPYKVRGRRSVAAEHPLPRLNPGKHHKRVPCERQACGQWQSCFAL